MWWLWILAGMALGAVFGWMGSRLRHRHILMQAQSLAEELVGQAEEKSRALLNESKDRAEEAREIALEQFEKDNRKFVERNRAREDDISDKNEQWQDQLRAREEIKERQEQNLRRRQNQVQSREGQVRKILQTRDQLGLRYREELLGRSQANRDEVIQQITAQLENEARHRATGLALAIEEENELNLEREAKRILLVALSRFARPYCAERGIGNVAFPSLEIKERTLGPERIHLKTLEKACGIDISINEEYQSASILGYDPVRRELGRLSLERMVNEKNLSEKRIDEIVQTCKRDLFKKIINDGNRVARELRMEGLSEEIRHMMGALRYRYSFAQNQHFHCAEVGFLCGLLGAELSSSVKDCRRSGLLHDIGKAMDHSREGGHAVIGAEFIEKHGEKPHIVHAVRAHHFDETPSTDMAYLVIAADAISGARPGARRSTVDSYTQKIADLQNIGNSFDGVLATYILSAGREVRVIVDSATIDDQMALDLSKKIARKIEEECSYPGLIKLTVVRETQAIEMAR